MVLQLRPMLPAPPDRAVQPEAVIAPGPIGNKRHIARLWHKNVQRPPKRHRSRRGPPPAREDQTIPLIPLREPWREPEPQDGTATGRLE